MAKFVREGVDHGVPAAGIVGPAGYEAPLGKIHAFGGQVEYGDDGLIWGDIVAGGKLRDDVQFGEVIFYVVCVFG